MCGLFGFISKAGGGPDLDRLRRIALETQTRGIHAFGLVWVTRYPNMSIAIRTGGIRISQRGDSYQSSW